MVFLVFGQARDLELFEQIFQHHAVKVIQFGPRELAFAHFFHGGAVTGAPAVRKMCPVDFETFGFAPFSTFGGDGTAPVHYSAEGVEDQSLGGTAGGAGAGKCDDGKTESACGKKRAAVHAAASI